LHTAYFGHNAYLSESLGWQPIRLSFLLVSQNSIRLM
jgi:hypothetical protein